MEINISSIPFRWVLFAVGVVMLLISWFSSDESTARGNFYNRVRERDPDMDAWEARNRADNRELSSNEILAGGFSRMGSMLVGGVLIIGSLFWDRIVTTFLKYFTVQ